MRWFRRRRPAPMPAQTSRSDIETAYMWDLTLDQWEAEHDDSRAWFRRNITHAPGFGETK